jgi:hypothetical protein
MSREKSKWRTHEGEIPLGYSTSHNKMPLFRMPYNSIPLVSEM